jgi:predicted flap endonuclease-1-like 5' DNA nuclease
MLDSMRGFRSISAGPLSFGLFFVRPQQAQGNGVSWWVWLLLLVILVIVIWWFTSRRKPKEILPEAVRMPTPEPVVPAAQPPTPDDLTKIEGIGPKIAALLQGAGITTFYELAETDVERIGALLKEAELRLADPSSWPEQARLAAEGDWDGLQALQDSLKGGRRV